MSLVQKLLNNILKGFNLIKKNIISLHRKIWGRGLKKFLFASVITIIILLIIFSITLNVTSKPSFCSNCHYMEPYYESWKTSTHNNVTCTDCHFPPGLKNKLKGKFTALSMVVNYFTGVYKKSKPWAEISDKSCLRSGCHEKRLLNGKVKFKEGIIFDHSPHLSNLRRNKKLRCTSCHSQIVQGSHLSVTETSCFLCHFKGVEIGSDVIGKCTKCHSPPVSGKGEEVSFDHTKVLNKSISCVKCHGNMVVGDGAVPKNRCSNCHAELHKIELYSKTELIHKNHITDHKIECNQCHTEIQHKSVARTRSVKPDCKACHSNSHNTQLAMFTGTEGKGVPDHPSLMFKAGLNCQACHVYHDIRKDFKITGETLKANERSCEPCHGRGYSKILYKWKKQTEGKIRKLSKIVKITRNRISRLKGVEKRAAEKLFSDALFNFDMVKFGKSIHNISYADLLLRKSYEMFVASLKKSNYKGPLPPFDTRPNIVPGECSNCHSDIIKKNVTIYGMNFLHKNHITLKELDCQKCHSNVTTHGQLIIKKNECSECHHKDPVRKNYQCSDCHKLQDEILNGKFLGRDIGTKNIMVNEINCSDCHTISGENISRPGKEICSECHEKDYEEMFDEWKKDSLNLMNKVKSLLKSSKGSKKDKITSILKVLNNDGSHGIHNPELYQIILEKVMTKSE